MRRQRLRGFESLPLRHKKHPQEGCFFVSSLIALDFLLKIYNKYIVLKNTMTLDENIKAGKERLDKTVTETNETLFDTGNKQIERLEIQVDDTLEDLQTRIKNGIDELSSSAKRTMPKNYFPKASS